MPRPTRFQHRQSNATLPLAIGACMAFAASANEALPTRILLAKWGENTARSQGQTFIIGNQTVKLLASEQKRRGYDAVPLDYDHQSVPGHPNFQPHPREYAAKHGRVEVVAGEGLYYSPGEYTPSGKKHAPSYQDVSGYFMLDAATREVIAVRSVALCEHGDVEGAEFIDATAIAAAAIGDLPDAIVKALTFARDLLEMDDEASAEDVADGLEDLLREKNQPTNPTPKPKPGDTGKPPTNQPANPKQTPAMDEDTKTAIAAQGTQIADLTKTVNTLAASVTGLTTNLAKDQHNAAVDVVLAAGVQEGKVIPDALKQKNDAGQYILAANTVQELVKVIPSTVPTNFLTPSFVAAAAQANESIEKEVALALSIKDEDMKKGSTLIHANAPHGDLAKAISTKS